MHLKLKTNKHFKNVCLFVYLRHKIIHCPMLNLSGLDHTQGFLKKNIKRRFYFLKISLIPGVAGVPGELAEASSPPKVVLP